MGESRTPTVAIILLAAGKSERMGENKLLLPLGRKLIIQHTLDNLMGSQAQQIIVVLGSKASEIKEAIGMRNVTTVLNPDYERGMSTSFSTGLKLLNKQVKFVLVALGDQPLIATHTYDHLITAAINSSHGLIVPTYHGKRGNPIAVSTIYEDVLLRQSGDIGGRELLRVYQADVLEVPVEDEGIIININTQDEYRKHFKTC